MITTLPPKGSDGDAVIGEGVRFVAVLAAAADTGQTAVGKVLSSVLEVIRDQQKTGNPVALGCDSSFVPADCMEPMALLK